MNGKVRAYFHAALSIILLAPLLYGVPQTKVYADTPVFTTEHIFEAEDGEALSPWQSFTNTNASKSTYLAVPASNAKQDPPTTADELSYPLQVDTGGSYKIWARVLAVDSGSDSFFWSVDGGSYQSYAMSSTSPDWVWIVLTTVTLSAGEHELKIKYREPKFGIDRLLVTSLASYTPTGIGTDPGKFFVDRMFEAEDGTVSSPWQTYSGGTSVSGSVYVKAPSPRSLQATASDPPELSYTVNVDSSGSYKIWARVLAQTTGSDSFHWAIDSGSYQAYHMGSQSEEWVWIAITTTTLSAGTHELKIKYREPDMGFDRLLVTGQTSFVPTGIGMDPGVNPTDTLFEAESSVIRSPWQSYPGDALSVSGATYLMVPSTYSAQSAPSASLELNYRIQASKNAAHKFWVRVRAPSAMSDSFYWSVDGGAYQTYHMGSQSENWVWVNFASTTLTPGEHELRIKYRESGMGFDRLIVSAKNGYTPSGLGSPPDGNLSWNNPYDAPPVTPPAEHPRLFVRASGLDEIRDRLGDGEVAEAWGRMLIAAQHAYTGTLAAPASGATNYNAEVMKTIKAKALLYLLNEDEDSGEKAVEMMSNYLDTIVMPQTIASITRQMGEVLTLGAIVYDWCYPLMNTSQRRDFVEHFVEIAAQMEIGFPPTGQGAVTSHGSEGQLLRDQLSVGIAVYDETPAIYNIVAGRFFQDYVDARNYGYEAGAQHQGDSYGPYRYQWDVFASWIFNRMGAGDVFDETQEDTPYQWIYARRPDGQLMRDGDTFQSVTALGQYWSDPMTYMLPASYYGDSVLKHEYLRQATYNTTMDDLWIILLDDPSVPSESEEKLPLTRYFGEPYGMMTARTGWAGGVRSSAVVVTMKIGSTWFGNHQHLDAGQFQLYYKGGLAIDSGVYQGTLGGYGSSHDMNYNKRTIAHNAMLVYDPNESFQYYTSVANDGGQRIPNNGTEPPTLDYLTDPANGYDTAQVDAHGVGPDEATPDYSYIKGNLTDAYSADKMDDYKRSFVFLNLKNDEHPAALVVFDKVSAAEAEFKKTWLLHSQTEPTVSGDTVTIERTDNGYNGKLVNRTLLPASGNLSIAKIGGSGSEFKVGATNYPQSQSFSANSAEAGAWRIEVSPEEAAQTDLFLNVMQVMDADGGPAPLTTEAIDSATMTGVLIADRAVLFAKSGESIASSASFELPVGADDVRVLVTDLSPGYWTVVRSGETAAVQYEVKEEDGTLYFEGGEAGEYTLTHASTRSLPAPDEIETLPVQPEAAGILLTVDGSEPDFNGNPPVLSNGVLTVPYEPMASAIRAKASLSGTALTLRRGGVEAKLAVGSDELDIDGKTVLLPAEVELRGTTVYVPLEAFVLAGWIKTDWDEFFRRSTVRTVQSMTEYAVEAVSSGDGDGELAADGDTQTYWSAESGDAWLLYDLGARRKFNEVDLAWYRADERTYPFELLVSEDGLTWSPVYSGESAIGADGAYEAVTFDRIEARYVKLIAEDGFHALAGDGDDAELREMRIATPYYPVNEVRMSDGSSTPGENAIDGHADTMWTAEGDGMWIEFDLGTSLPVAGVGTAWYRGTERLQYYDILLSDDRTNWTTVFEGSSSGTTNALEDVSFTLTNARYVRIVGHGNSLVGNNWNSLTEAVVYKPQP
ncbi:heparin/heparin-sulfate lyase HepB [Cohnella sp. GCM10020058]|uniref:heparin/heparin-sulfate lyase HepB n=1 Tax=Cohnella sp. GCM10020058 TaxID=3317330 RepID=UPI003634A82E